MFGVETVEGFPELDTNLDFKIFMLEIGATLHR